MDIWVIIRDRHSFALFKLRDTYRDEIQTPIPLHRGVSSPVANMAAHRSSPYMSWIVESPSRDTILHPPEEILANKQTVCDDLHPCRNVETDLVAAHALSFPLSLSRIMQVLTQHAPQPPGDQISIWSAHHLKADNSVSDIFGPQVRNCLKVFEVLRRRSYSNRCVSFHLTRSPQLFGLEMPTSFPLRASGKQLACR